MAQRSDSPSQQVLKTYLAASRSGSKKPGVLDASNDRLVNLKESALVRDLELIESQLRDSQLSDLGKKAGKDP